MRHLEVPVEAAAKTIGDTTETRFELGAALMFQEDYPRQDHCQPITKPHKEHRPVSPMIDPEPKEHEISEIEVAAERRVVGYRDPSRECDVGITADWVINDAAMHENFISRAVDR
jgi:hypothetical protein